MQLQKKQCSKCGKVKCVTEFSKDAHKPSGYTGKCKQCRNLRARELWSMDPDRYRAYAGTPEERRAYQRNYWNKTKEARNKYQREWAAANKDKIAMYARKTRASSLHTKIMSNLRGRINYALHQESITRKSSTPALLGCSIETLKAHLEAQFQPGMTWDNYGKGLDCWHIDHIRPCALFDLSDIKEQVACFNYKNLRPLWASENLSLAVKAKTFKRRNGKMKQSKFI